MSTIITPRREEGSHWYRVTGEACHEVPKKDGTMRKTTLADARKMNLVPSVTTVLRVLDKPGLNRWKQEQAVLAAVTTPRAPEEGLDSFVSRVLDEDAEQESQQARDRGTEIHGEMQAYWECGVVSPELREWCLPVYEALRGYGDGYCLSEQVLVGEGYAGTADLIQRTPMLWRIWDYKTCKKLPKEPWDEHRLQLSAYAAAFMRGEDYDADKKPIVVGNVYISTTEPGQFAVYEHEDWEGTYERGFLHALALWQFTNNYQPKQ